MQSQLTHLSLCQATGKNMHMVFKAAVNESKSGKKSFIFPTNMWLHCHFLIQNWINSIIEKKLYLELQKQRQILRHNLQLYGKPFLWKNGQRSRRYQWACQLQIFKWAAVKLETWFDLTSHSSFSKTLTWPAEFRWDSASPVMKLSSHKQYMHIYMCVCIAHA